MAIVQIRKLISEVEQQLSTSQVYLIPKIQNKICLSMEELEERAVAELSKNCFGFKQAYLSKDPKFVAAFEQYLQVLINNENVSKEVISYMLVNMQEQAKLTKELEELKIRYDKAMGTWRHIARFVDYIDDEESLAIKREIAEKESELQEKGKTCEAAKNVLLISYNQTNWDYDADYNELHQLYSGGELFVSKNKTIEEFRDKINPVAGKYSLPVKSDEYINLVEFAKETGKAGLPAEVLEEVKGEIEDLNPIILEKTISIQKKLNIISARNYYNEELSRAGNLLTAKEKADFISEVEEQVNLHGSASDYDYKNAKEIKLLRAILAAKLIKRITFMKELWTREQLNEQVIKMYGYSDYRDCSEDELKIIGIEKHQEEQLMAQILECNSVYFKYVSNNELEDNYEVNVRTNKQLTSQSKALKSSFDSLHKQELDKAVDLLVEEIKETEGQRIKRIDDLINAYDLKIKQLITNKISGLQERSEVEKQELEEKLKALKVTFEDNIKQVNDELEYKRNDFYAENLSFLAKYNFWGAGDKKSENIVNVLKQTLNTRLENTINIERERVEAETNLKTLQIKQREFLAEQGGKLANAKKADKEFRAKNPSRAEIKEYELDLDLKNKKFDREKQELHDALQQAFATQAQLKRTAVQRYALEELEKRELQGLVPPKFPDFIKGYKDLTIEQFKDKIDSLANSKDFEIKEKLFSFANEAIANIPGLGVPDVLDSVGLGYSDDNINDMVRAYIILEKAVRLAKNQSETKSNSLYFQERYKALKVGFEVLHTNLLENPKIEATLGFELLPAQEESEFFQKLSKLDLTSKNGSLAAQKLNTEIAKRVNAVKFEQAKSQLDNELNQNSKFHARLQLEENRGLYSGLINNYVVLSELSGFADRLNNYLNSIEFSNRETLKKRKQKELDDINKEIEEMRKGILEDVQKTTEILSYSADEQTLSESFSQNAMHCFTKAAYIGGGAVIGSSIGVLYGADEKYGLHLLGKATSTPELMKVANLGLYQRARIGVGFGKEAADIATRYSTANIAAHTSKSTHEKIKKYEKLFNSQAPMTINVNQKFKEVSKNYLDGASVYKNSITNRWNFWAQNNRKLLAGVAFGVVAVLGFASALITFGATAGFLAPALISLGGIILGYTSKKAVDVGTSFLAKKVITNQLGPDSVYSNAMRAIESAEKKLNKKVKFKNLQEGDQLLRVKAMVDSLFKQQFAAIKNRVQSYKPSQISSVEAAKEFDQKVLREMYCLEQMKETQSSLVKTSQEIDADLMANPELAKDKQQKLLELLSSYLEDNYKYYHKTHLVEQDIEIKKLECDELAEKMHQRGKLREKVLGERSRKKYMAHEYESKVKVEKQSKLKEEEKILDDMVKIKSTLEELKQKR